MDLGIRRRELDPTVGQLMRADELDQVIGGMYIDDDDSRDSSPRRRRVRRRVTRRRVTHRRVG